MQKRLRRWLIGCFAVFLVLSRRASEASARRLSARGLLVRGLIAVARMLDRVSDEVAAVAGEVARLDQNLIIVVGDIE